MLEVNPVINPVNFRSGVRTALAKQLTAVIGFGGDELGRRADFAKEIVIAKILHKILPVRGHTERNS